MYVKVRTLLWGLASAFALGAVFGMLQAPASGARTRRRLERKRHEIGDKASAAIEAAEELVESVRHPLA
jgi:hypothetical protein